MPRKLRNPKTRISDELTKPQWNYLLTGHYFGLGEPFEDDEKERQAWLVNQESLLQDWFSREPQLFCRPWAWWQYDAPEGRRQLSDEPIDDVETQYSYLQRHPELQTTSERRAKLSAETIAWRCLPASEVADDAYIADHAELLSESELIAFQAHVASMQMTKNRLMQSPTNL